MPRGHPYAECAGLLCREPAAPLFAGGQAGGEESECSRLLLEGLVQEFWPAALDKLLHGGTGALRKLSPEQSQVHVCSGL